MNLKSSRIQLYSAALPPHREKEKYLMSIVASSSIVAHNPIIEGNWADPYIFKDGLDFYLYPTGCDHETQFYAFHSQDLSTWSVPRLVLDLRNFHWAKDQAWAPCVGFYDNFYWMYFSSNSRIGVGKSHSPLGPFEDALGRPLIETNEWNCQSIDPDIYIENGQAYLLWGQGRCWIVPLQKDMVSFAAPPVCLSDQLYLQAGRDPQHIDIEFFNEGTHLQKVGERYLLTWTNYDFRDIRYQVRYAWADTIFGPYIAPENNVIIEPGDDVVGTGHASMVEHEGCYYLFYHRMAGQLRDGSQREVCCHELLFENGEPQKIVPLSMSARQTLLSVL
jgi:xylan 1,4-beta-xylosidase